MNEILSDMYDTSDYQLDKDNQTTISIKNMNILKEVEINGNKLYTVDPVEFLKMENQLKHLKHRMDVAEQRIKVLHSVIRDKDVVINQLRRELDTKIGYN